MPLLLNGDACHETRLARSTFATQELRKVVGDDLVDACSG